MGRTVWGASLVVFFWLASATDDAAYGDAPMLSWDDVVKISNDTEYLRLAAAYLFAPSFNPAGGTDICQLIWLPPLVHSPNIPRWPVCREVPMPPPLVCVAYSVGLLPDMDLERALVSLSACNVRAFDRDAAHMQGHVSNTLHVHPAVLTASTNLEAMPPEATLSTLMALEYDQGRTVYVLHLDCAECALKAFAQSLSDLGPGFLLAYDMVWVRVPLEYATNHPLELAAFVILLRNAQFRPYHRRARIGRKTLPSVATFIQIAMDAHGDSLFADATWEDSGVLNSSPGSVKDLDIAFVRDAALPSELSFRYVNHAEGQCGN